MQYQQMQQDNAQSAYAEQTKTAIGGLQTGKAGLSQQYADLLKTVTGEYQPLINQTTATAGEALAKRGLSPDSQLYQTQTQGALQPIYGAEAANAQQIGQGSISDTNTYNQAIAGAQLGVAGTSSQLPLQYGSLSLSQQLLPSQIAGNIGQADYYGGLNANQLAIAQLGASKPFESASGLVFNPSSGNFTTAKGGGDINPIKEAMRTLMIKNNKTTRPAQANIAHYAN